MPETSVIIPNWNGRALLKISLDSLGRQTYRDFEIIVVDNGSEDDSVELVRTYYSDVRLIRFPANKGFCRAVNAGVESAAGKYIALLNNDVEAGPAWLGELVKALSQNPEVGSCASKMLNFFQRSRIDNAGDRLAFYGYAEGNNEIDSGQYDRPRYLFSVCAGAALYRKEMLMAIGLFDEDFFAYCEDIDLGLRAQLTGFKCLFVPTAIVYHMHHATSDRIPAKRFYWIQRNIVFVHLKNMPFKMLLKKLPSFFIFHIIVSILYFARTRDIRTVIAIYRDILIRMPVTLKKRRAIQKNIKVPPAYIKSIIDPWPSLSLLIKKLKHKWLRLN